jgi:hypothetical protein
MIEVVHTRCKIIHEYDEHDYPEHAKYENGNYWNTCCECGLDFVGLKNTPTCKLCHEKANQDGSTTNN